MIMCREVAWIAFIYWINEKQMQLITCPQHLHFINFVRWYFLLKLFFSNCSQKLLLLFSCEMRGMSMRHIGHIMRVKWATNATHEPRAPNLLVINFVTFVHQKQLLSAAISTVKSLMTSRFWKLRWRVCRYSATETGGMDDKLCLSCVGPMYYHSQVLGAARNVVN